MKPYWSLLVSFLKPHFCWLLQVLWRIFTCSLVCTLLRMNWRVCLRIRSHLNWLIFKLHCICTFTTIQPPSLECSVRSDHAWVIIIKRNQPLVIHPCMLPSRITLGSRCTGFNISWHWPEVSLWTCMLCVQDEMIMDVLYSKQEPIKTRESIFIHPPIHPAIQNETFSCICKLHRYRVVAWKENQHSFVSFWSHWN